MEHAKGISPRLGDKQAKQKSAFARTSAFANYKLSAFADYSRPLLLAPRQSISLCAKPLTSERRQNTMPQRQ
jgi:hypothetical protein